MALLSEVVGWSKEISPLLVHPSGAAPELRCNGKQVLAGDILASFTTRAATHQANAGGAEAEVREVPSRLGKGNMAAL